MLSLVQFIALRSLVKRAGIKDSFIDREYGETNEGRKVKLDGPWHVQDLSRMALHNW